MLPLVNVALNKRAHGHATIKIDVTAFHTLEESLNIQ